MSDMPPPPPDDSGWSSSQPPQPPPPAEPPSHTPEAATETKQAVLGTGGSVELAGRGSRLGAKIIDWVILIVVSIVLGAILLADDLIDSLSDSMAGRDSSMGAGFYLSLVFLILVVAAYDIVLVATRGQTLGKMATRIKVVRADDGELPGWDKSAMRWLVPGIPYAASWLISVNGLTEILGILSLLVYVSMTWDKILQGWHDKAAGTLVIKV